MIPRVVRPDEVIWEGLEGKPYFRDGPELGSKQMRKWRIASLDKLFKGLAINRSGNIMQQPKHPGFLFACLLVLRWTRQLIRGSANF